LDSSDPDARLMLAFQQGDASAFDGLFRRWAGPLLRYLERLVRDAAAAEEILQETFLRVHRARERYAAEARFSTWLYRIATNLAFNELRRPRRRREHAPLDAPGAPEPVDGGPGADERADARRLHQRVSRELESLPDRQRAALWLVAVEGRSYAEVARFLDTSESSVKSLVHRARAALVGALDESRAAAADGPAPGRRREGR